MRQPLPLLLLAMALVPLWAEPMTLSLDDAVGLAMRASLDMQGNDLAVASAKRSLENSWNLFLPGISSSLGASLSDDLFIDTPARAGVAAANPFGTTVTLGTRLTVGTAVLFDLEARRAAYRSSVLDRQMASASLTRDVEKAYFAIVSLELDLQNKGKAAELSAERQRLAAFRFERGLGSELDVLKAQMSELNARAAVEKADADFRKRQATFRRQLGLPAGTQLTLSTALEIPPGIHPQAPESLIDGRLDLEKARLAMAAAASAVARYDATVRLPVVTLEAGWNFGLDDFSDSSDQFTLKAGLAFNPDAWIPRSQKDLALRSLREAQDSQAAKYQQGLRNARDEIEALLLDIGLAARSLELADGQVSLAERIYVRTKEAWERASATGLELEEAGLAVDSAQQSLIAVRYQYLSLLIDLGYALNVDWRTLAP
ncbi:MAG: hypothetical protein CVV51_12215 [Spirochaetae bacterium HGW-Spirochaetae-7]|nr:MAG: hypothetical protein CVV51_12215 [Spirochaetae bacterium HGW-Spirochaetae-7]